MMPFVLHEGKTGRQEGGKTGQFPFSHFLTFSLSRLPVVVEGI